MSDGWSFPQGAPDPRYPTTVGDESLSWNEWLARFGGQTVGNVRWPGGEQFMGGTINDVFGPSSGFYNGAGGTGGPGGGGVMESPEQRLDRITNKLLAGELKWDDFRASVDRLAGKTHQAPGVGAGGDEAALAGGFGSVRARVAQVFQNRGVPLDRYNPGDGTQGPGGGSAGPVGGGPSPGGGSNPGGAALDATQRDALAVIRGVLSEYGLESLADWAWEQVRNGYSSTEIILSLRERQEYKDRFPAIEARQRQGLAPISPGEYVAYERSLQQMETAAGLLRGTLSGRDKVNTYLERDLSVTELQERVNTYIDAAVRSPAEDVAFLRDTYGLSPGELASFFIDPDIAQPLIEQRWQAAQVGGAGLRVGYEVSGAEAESIARLGVGREGAQEGFGTLASSTELFSSLPGENSEEIGRSDQIGAVFGGNEFARKRIAKKQRERVATFEQGGGFGATREGFAGLGAAR